MSPRHLILPALLALALGTNAVAQQVSPLQQHMGNADFTQSGLNKLTPQELQHLQQWLAGHAAELAAAVPASDAHSATAAAAHKSKGGGWFGHRDAGTPSTVVSSRIAGSFKGWGPHTTFVLQNGQQWRVVDDSDLTVAKTLEDPAVTIKPGLIGGWIFKVAGYNTSARVAPAN